MGRGQTRRLAVRAPLLAGLLAAGLVAGPGSGEARPAAEAMAPDLAAAADLLAAEEFDAAQAMLDSLRQRHPDEAAIHAQLGNIAFELRDYRAAVKYFERAIALAPLEADYPFELGRALIGRIAGAGLFKKPGLARRMRAAFEEALRLEPDHPRARLALVSYLANAPGIMGGSKKKARAEAARLKQIDPATYSRALARLAVVDERQTAAFEHYRASLEARFDTRTAGEFAAWLESQERWDEALAVVARAIGPGDGGATPLLVYYIYGRLAASSGRQLAAGGRALDHFMAADRRRKSPKERVESHYLRGRIYEQSGQLAAARAAYGKTLVLDQGHKQAGRALRRLGQADGGG